MKMPANISKFSRPVNKAIFKVQKHSPEILIVSGIIGLVTGAVMACKATLKATDVVHEARVEIDNFHEKENTSDLSKENRSKELLSIYTKAGIGLAKLYTPSILIGTVSVMSILASNNILRKRNIALAAAYTTIDKGFKEYRKRVVDRFGEEVDRELKYDLKSKKIEETITDPETGKEKKVKKDIVVSGLEDYSEYARFFDESSSYWEKDAEYNLMFLRSMEQYANDLLQSKGYLFLNDVYDMLGIPESKAGQVVGWIYDPDNKDHNGDNHVDFGMNDIHKPKARDFVNGFERIILLDFNVDGNIWELMP